MPHARLCPPDERQTRECAGWYTLYSLALGCSVAVFEPVGHFRDVIKLGLQLNPGFANRTALFANVVFSSGGNFSVLSAKGHRNPSRRTMMGMASMQGPSGRIKDVARTVPGTLTTTMRSAY